MKKETVKSVKKEFEELKTRAKQHIKFLANPERRRLLSIDAADAQGKLNGMTVVELLTIVNLSAATGERIQLEAIGKTIVVFAEKVAPYVPLELRS